MDNFQLEKNAKFIQSKELILGKMTLDSNNNILIDNKTINNETMTFDKLSDLINYINNNPNSIGHIYSVVDTINNLVTVYKVNIDKTVSKIETGSNIDIIYGGTF